MPLPDDDRTNIADAAWVAIDVAAEALGISIKQAYRIAKTDQWRTAPGHYPKQFLFNDIRTTYQTRKATP